MGMAVTSSQCQEDLSDKYEDKHGDTRRGLKLSLLTLAAFDCSYGEFLAFRQPVAGECRLIENLLRRNGLSTHTQPPRCLYPGLR
jgi:hypothetical protein